MRNYYTYISHYEPQTRVAIICDEKDAYRFGFNGQEKVNEIAGMGNHTTALFWEYDTRLGRRWNVDPVVKPWRSPYDAFDNSPIWKVDPDGDDDFFDSKGNFVKRTGKGTQIVIMGVNGINKLTDINFKNITSTKDLAYKLQLASKIGTHYGKQVGVTGFVGVAPDAKSDAFTRGSQVNLSVNPTTGKVFSNDYRSIKNVLVHEKGHQDDYKSDIANNRIPDITFEEHVSVYTRQFNDRTFKDLDEAEKIGRVSNAVGYALNSINQHKEGSDRRNNLSGEYRVIEDINASVAQYNISVELNDGDDVTKGYKIQNKEGERQYKFEEKKDAH